MRNSPITGVRSGGAIGRRRLRTPVICPDILSQELTEFQQIIGGHKAHLPHLISCLKLINWLLTSHSALPNKQTTNLEPLRVRGRPVQDLEPVSFRKAELCVALSLEGVESHHDVQDILRYTVGVGVVYLLLSVVGGEPPDLQSNSTVLPGQQDQMKELTLFPYWPRHQPSPDFSRIMTLEPLTRLSSSSCWAW